jgi:hypothetical protein
MIRDFCKISKGKLVDEIKELRALVQSGKAPAGVQADTMDAQVTSRHAAAGRRHATMSMAIRVTGAWPDTIRPD